MAVNEADINFILAKRYDNGGDYWATQDGRIYVGNPFSTISSLGMLYELGVTANHEAISGGLSLILDRIRQDGRLQVAPKAPMYPCYTAEAVRVLCRFGLGEHDAVLRTVSYLINNTYHTGGWRCNFTRFGRGPETEWANPGATLYALDVLRFLPEYRNGVEEVDQAVKFLLDHWDSRNPLGPCHWGIGTQFLKVEFPFLRYNLFYYVYILSFFPISKEDSRFLAAAAFLKSKENENGEIIIEKTHRRLKGLEFCTQGQPSALTTKRYLEIWENISR